MIQLVIQTATHDDYPQVIILLQMLAHGEGMICMLDAGKLEQAVQCAAPRLEVLVAKKDSAVLGCALFYRGFDVLSATYGTHLSDIIVREGERGLGVGTKLMQAVAKHTETNGGEWLSWTVDAQNICAKYFYERLGAEVINVDFMAMGITNMRILMQKT